VIPTIITNVWQDSVVPHMVGKTRTTEYMLIFLCLYYILTIVSLNTYYHFYNCRCGVTAKPCDRGCQHVYGKCNEHDNIVETPLPPHPNDANHRDDTSNESNDNDDDSGLVLYTCEVPHSFAMTFDDGQAR
jgi:hypothetical protein